MKKNVPRSNICQRRTRNRNSVFNISTSTTCSPFHSALFTSFFTCSSLFSSSLLSIGNEKSEKSMLGSPMCSNAQQQQQQQRQHKKQQRLKLCNSTTTLFALIFIIFVNTLNFGNCSIVGSKSDSLSAFITNAQQNQQQQNQSVYASTFKDDETVAAAALQSEAAADTATDAQTRHRALRQTNVTTDFLINGFRVERSDHEVEYDDNGVPTILSESEATVRIFGTGLTNDTVIAFTTRTNDYGGPCQFPVTLLFRPIPGSVTDKNALYQITLPKKSKNLYICAKIDASVDKEKLETTIPLVHQGPDSWLQISTYETLLPLWASIVVILLCLCFSALFSGLNLGLMSLDRTELKILRNTGSPKEREYARKIQPVRDQGNFLLCAILLGNVLVNSTFTILLDGLTSGLVAVICSTLAIVIFGEITPQAVCSRHGLAVGAKTILITKTVMILTFPLAYPVSKFLDFCLGEEIGNVYNRERLKELVRVTTGINDLDKNEVNIISGALELRKKTVGDVMTHIEDAFMLSLDAVLDFTTVSDIMKSGYSRIPVFDGDKKNIVTLLYIKDLAFVDTDDNTPLRTLCEFYQNPVHFVFEDYTLDVMFNQFKDGTIGHIAFVHRVNNEGDGDPFYETVGLVTLEDVIEELIQAEIVDETDVYTDNRTKVRRNRKKQDFSAFAERRENQKIRISPQLTLATFQYLSTSVDAFKKETISEAILRRLLNQDIIQSIKCKGKNKDDPRLFIFQQGKAVDFFVLILEGRVEVTVGKENLLFETGPFTYFGTQALVPNVVVDSPTQQQMVKGSMQSLNMDTKIRQTFVPDYSVRAATDVVYIAIKRSLYLTAKKATLLERTRKSGTEGGNEMFDDEVEKFLHSLNEDDKQFHGSQSIRKVSAVNGSNTASPSLNDVSMPLSRSNATVPQLISQGSNSADINDDMSLNELNAVEQNGGKDNIVLELLLPKTVEHFGEKDNVGNASTPLLSKSESDK